MTAPRSSLPAVEATTEKVLLFEAGGLRCALPLRAVRETLRPLALEACPGTPGYVVGLARVRGAPTPVVSAATLLGRTGGVPRRWLTLAAGAVPVALAVDAVIGVRELERSTFGQLPPLVSAGAPGAVRALAMVDARLLALLDAGRLVSDELLAALAHREAR